MAGWARPSDRCRIVFLRVHALIPIDVWLALGFLVHLFGAAPEGGTGCHDDPPAWWSGADRAGAGGVATPVLVRLRNTGGQTLYLPGTVASGVGFQIFTTGPRRRALELLETQFCPVLCPAKGPPSELDCGRTLPAFTELRPGSTAELRWSGEEVPELFRRCAGGPALPCRVRRVTVAGEYQLEVCPHLEVTGGRRLPDGRLQGAAAKTPPRCQQVRFRHPVAGPIQLSLR
jgi:hypothetical protein